MSRGVAPLVRKVVVVAFVAATATVAYAASLGGVDAGTLDAWVMAADIGPGPIACTDFNGIPDNGPIHGTPVGCGGGVWTANGGNWHVVSGQVKANTQASTVTTTGPSPFLSAAVTVVGANQSNRIGGVLISYDAGTNSYLAAVIVGPGRVELRVVTAGSSTVLASANAKIGFNTRLRITRTTTTVTVTVDTANVISVPFSPTLLTGTGEQGR
ncbi:MAG TPA: hypothetical protein VGK49_12625 [Ilumatobacteraceae bacterium]